MNQNVLNIWNKRSQVLQNAAEKKRLLALVMEEMNSRNLMLANKSQELDRLRAQLDDMRQAFDEKYREWQAKQDDVEQSIATINAQLDDVLIKVYGTSDKQWVYNDEKGEYNCVLPNGEVLIAGG